MVKCGTYMRKILTRVRNLLKPPSAWFVIISLLFLTAISYGQTIFMYFLIDDNAIIYKLQHLEQTIGLFGKGIFGEGPYRHVVDQYIPFYPIFGINPVPYFAIGVILYFLASLVIYFFVKDLTKSKIIAFATSAIFASGYVGSEAMFGIFNSWQTTRGIIMALGVLWLFYKFKTSGKFIFYVFSVILFFFSLDTVYIRAPGLIFAVIVFDIIFWPVTLKLSSVLKLIARQIPFLGIHYYIYLASSAIAQRFGILHLLGDIFTDGKLVLATIPFQDIGNLFIPDIITSHADKIISQSIIIPSGLSIGSFIAGIFVIAIFLYLVARNARSENLLTRVLIFSAFFAVFNFIVFWAKEPQHSLWTTHRYFLYSFVGVSLFWSTGFYLLAKTVKKAKLFKILTTAAIITYLSLGINYQHDFNQRRSFPAKRLFASFDNAVPNIPKGAVIYFDVANDSKIRGELGSFFGGIFSEGSNFAIYTGSEINYMTDFIFTYKFSDLLQALKDGNTSIDKVFTFYYGESGLVDTSQKTRELLTNGQIVKIGDTFGAKTLLSEDGGKTIGKNPKIEISIAEDVPSLVPSSLSFSMTAMYKIPPLPYEARDMAFSINSNEKKKIFSYLLSQTRFRKTAVATSASFWKEQDPKFAIDGRLETSWRGHRGFWDNIDRGITKDVEYLGIDLGKILTVSQVMWVSAQRPLAPTHYKILTSEDGKSWHLAKEVKNGKELPEGTIVVDSFDPIPARYVKMEILRTYGNDGPEIKEFEVIEARYANLDQKLVERVRKAPFGKIETLHDFNDALTFVRQNASLRFYYQSSADSKQDPTKYVDVPLLVDGKSHEYSIPLPATGISWTQFTLEGFNFPAEIVIQAPKITYESVSK